MNVQSLHKAIVYAQDIANSSGLASAVYKPFNSDSYEVVLGWRETCEAEAHENFVGRFVPE